jgi:hypothetical protein
VNITDVTQTRASRVTAAVVTAKAALDDAMAARDRECGTERAFKTSCEKYKSRRSFS